MRPTVPQVDWIVTNPPTSRAAVLAFALRALTLAPNVALFARLQWLESAERYVKLFQPHPPTLIAPFTERVPLHKGRWVVNGSTATAYTWIVWAKGIPPQPPFWIPPGCRKQLTKPSDYRLPGFREIETGEHVRMDPMPMEGEGSAPAPTIMKSNVRRSTSPT